MADDRAEGGDESVDDDVDPAPDHAEPERDVLTHDDLNTSSRGVLPIALLVIVGIVAGFILGRVTAPDEEQAADGDEAAAPGEGEGGALPFPTGDVNRTGYWGFANLEPIVIDTFDRADDPASLGDAGTGQAWEAVAGTWGTEGDRAVTAGGARDTPNLAVVPEGEGDGLTEVTMMVVEEGAGLVFRYLDPENYWSVTANPGVGSWTLEPGHRGRRRAGERDRGPDERRDHRVGHPGRFNRPGPLRR